MVVFVKCDYLPIKQTNKQTAKQNKADSQKPHGQQEHTSKYIRFVNPGRKLFGESQLKPL